MYEIYVRQAVSAGLADSEAGRVTSVEQVQKTDAPGYDYGDV